MIRILDEAGARAIVFDVLFSEPSDAQKDALLTQAIRESGKVYLAQAFQEFKIHSLSEVLTSLPQFTEHARGTGHINLQPDRDGVMRRVPLLYGGQTPQLAFSVALDLMGADLKEVKQKGHALVVPRKGKGPFRVPLDEDNHYVISWAGRWQETFEHYSYAEVVSSYAALQKGEKPLISPDVFKDKICFVGTTAAGLFDMQPTPLEPSYPTVGVHLNVLDNLLNERFIRPLYSLENFFVLLVVAVVLFRIMKLKNFFKTALWILTLLLGCVAAAVAGFLLLGVWVQIIYVVSLVLTTYFSVTVYNQLSVTLERARLLKLATRDSLTGLYNIGHFKLLFKAELETVAVRREKKLSLMMGDVDNFKETNDTYGHLMGDAVLREVAAAIKSNCRVLDVAARYGGEEIVLMLPGAHVEDAFKVAEKIRREVEQKVFFHEKGDFRTSISIGVTEVGPDDKALDPVIARADGALYEAKRTGKNKVVVAGGSPGAPEPKKQPKKED